jgi:hypothetical protein
MRSLDAILEKKDTSQVSFLTSYQMPSITCPNTSIPLTDFFLFGTLQIASSLGDMNKSFDVLKEIPEFRAHRHTIALYIEKLESIVRPKLLQSFNQHNTGSYVSVTNFGRLSESIQPTSVFVKRNK